MDFSFDTSAFIEPHIRLYPRDLFEAHWQWVERLIGDGTIRCSELVKIELSKTEDDLFKWSKDQENLFIPIDTETQTALKEVIRKFPIITDYHRDRSGADPWVIALAMANDCHVVTYENMGKKNEAKIPNICRYFSIKCYTWIEVFRETGFSSKK